MTDLISFGVIGSFWGGVVSFFSPCTLPIIPGYLSYIAGLQAEDSAKGRFFIFKLSLCFVVGFSTVFIALGVGSTFLGSFIRHYRYEMSMLGGLFIILLGLFMTGLFRFSWLYKEMKFAPAISGGTPLAAFLIGVTFSLGWTPCIGPILAAILTFSAMSNDQVTTIIHLTSYSAGLAIPFLFASLFVEGLSGQIRKLSRFGQLIRIGTGGILVLVGFIMVTGNFTAFSSLILSVT